MARGWDASPQRVTPPEGAWYSGFPTNVRRGGRLGEDRQLGNIIGQLYDAALDKELFAEIPAMIAAHFGAESAMIHTCAPKSLDMPAVLGITKNHDATVCRAYVEHFHYVNEWFKRGIKKPIPAIVLGQELVSETELVRLEFYDFCRMNNVFHLLGASTLINDQCVAGIGIHRPRGQSRFDEQDRRKMALLLPHLTRALQIQNRFKALEWERTLAFDVIDRLALGVIFVGADAHVLFANRIAERVLRAGQGLLLLQGRLRSQEPGKQPSLDRLIGEAARTSAGDGIKAGGMLSIARPTGAPMAILVSPFRAMSVGYGLETPTAVVIFSDPDSENAVSENVLRAALELTPAEGRLVSALIAGQKLTEYAEAAGISINTAKTQMRQVFHKTGHTRQVDLIRAIVGNPVTKLAHR